jgi:hypothetical protein
LSSRSRDFCLTPSARLTATWRRQPDAEREVDGDLEAALDALVEEARAWAGEAVDDAEWRTLVRRITADRDRR